MDNTHTREQEKQERRQAMLDAAQEIAAVSGWSSVTIRKVAEKVQYSPGMVYEYFENKDDLLISLIREAYHHLFLLMQQAYQQEGNADDRLVVMMLAFWHFAMQKPELYQAMNGVNGIPLYRKGLLPETLQLTELITKALSSLAAFRTDEELADGMFIAQGTINGLAATTLSGSITGGPERGETLLEQAIRNLIIAWRVRYTLHQK